MESLPHWSAAWGPKNEAGYAGARCARGGVRGNGGDAVICQIYRMKSNESLPPQNPQPLK
jgi:hypothetical protein